MAILCSHLLFIKGLRNTGKKENTKPSICRKWEIKGEKASTKKEKIKEVFFSLFFFSKRWKATKPLPSIDMLSTRGWKDSSRTPLTELSPSVLSSYNLNYSCLRGPVPLTNMQDAQLRGTGAGVSCDTPVCPVWFPSQGEDGGTNQPHQPSTCSCLSPFASSQPRAWMPGCRCR